MTAEPVSGRRAFPPVAVGLAVVGGLVLVGATSGNWVLAESVRDVGGVELVAPQGTTGLEMAPQGVAAGVLGALAGLALVVARGRGRRLIGVLLLLVGVAACVVVGIGVTRSLAEPGQLTPAPWIALVGAGMIVAGGAVAWRRPSPPRALGDRYTLEGDEAADDEWRLASDEGSGGSTPQGP